jgi:parallel beta-helix repeat protein
MQVVEMIEVLVNGRIGGSGKISGFTLQNGLAGVGIQSHNNTVEDNIIKGCQCGVFLSELSSFNVVRRNTITSNEFGILSSEESHDNMIYHNNFINNTNQAADEGGENTWEHENEGNYWSDYNGTDTDQDHVGDIPYIINITQGLEDNFPLACFYVPLRGDLNDDGKVNMPDLSIAATSFAAYPRHPRWNPAADLNSDGKVNIIDLVIIAAEF